MNNDDQIANKRKQILIVFVVGLAVLFFGIFSGHPSLSIFLGISIIFFGMIYVAGSSSPEGGLWAVGRFVGWSIQGLGILGLLLLTLSKGSFISILSFSIIPLSFIILPILFFKLTQSKKEKIQDSVKKSVQLTNEDIEFIDNIVYRLQEQIKKIEKERIFKLPITILTILLFNSPFIFFTYSYLQKENQKDVLFFIIFMSIWFIIATWGAMVIIRKYLITNYTRSFKESIILEIVKCLSINCHYSFNSYTEESNFRHSNLFPYFNKYNGDDLITGEINSLKFQCSELHVQNIDSDSKDEIFHGLFFVIDIPVNIQIPFGTNSDFGDEILLDNVEFNELFKVFGNDSTEVFYILSSKVLEKMVNFVCKTGHNFQFSFKGNKLYIAIVAGVTKQFFEPPIFKSLWDYKIYDEIVMDFKLIFELLNQLEFRRSLS